MLKPQKEVKKIIARIAARYLLARRKVLGKLLAKTHHPCPTPATVQKPEPMNREL
jgi:hypothetical protein